MNLTSSRLELAALIFHGILYLAQGALKAYIVPVFKFQA